MFVFAGMARVWFR